MNVSHLPWKSTISQKIFETNSVLYFKTKIAHYRKSLIAIFRDFFASINKTFMLGVHWVPNYHVMKFKYFPNIS